MCLQTSAGWQLKQLEQTGRERSNIYPRNMGDISFINESFCPDNEVDNCGSPTDDSTDVVDQTQKNGVAPQIQDSQSNNNSLAQKQLQLMPKSQKIGRTTCVTLMYLCEVSSL